MPDMNVLERVRQKRPLVHCIANIVTANDCANILYAVGASPMMAEAPEEMLEITALADATVLNLGTPSRVKYAAAKICLEESNRLKKPVVLDPVGVGASSWRLSSVSMLLEAGRPDVVRVNLAEAEALLGLGRGERGVDSPGRSEAEPRAAAAAALAERLGCTVLLTGAADYVSDGTRTEAVTGGSELMPPHNRRRLYAQRPLRRVPGRRAGRLRRRAGREPLLETLLRGRRGRHRPPRPRLPPPRPDGHSLRRRLLRGLPHFPEGGLSVYI